MTDARLSQLLLEILTQADPDARLSQELIEVLAQTDPDARGSQLILEVLVTVGAAPTVTWFPLPIQS